MDSCENKLANHIALNLHIDSISPAVVWIHAKTSLPTTLHRVRQPVDILFDGYGIEVTIQGIAIVNSIFPAISRQNKSAPHHVGRREHIAAA